MSSPLPAPSIQRCNYRSAGKNRKPSSTTRFFCIKTAGRGSLKRGSGQHSFGFPRTSEFGLSPHPDYVLKWRKKPCALLDFAQELCLRGSGFAFLRRAAARVGLSGSGASRFPSEKVLKTALKLPLAYIDSVQYACLPWQKLNLGRGSARWKCWLLAIPCMSMTTFVPRRFPVTMFRSWRPTRRAATGSSLHASWKELLQHLDQAYEFDRVVYLSTYLTPHTEAVGDIELLRSVFRACMGRQIQLLFVTGPMGADGAVDAAGQNGQGHHCPCGQRAAAATSGPRRAQAKILRVPYLYTASPTLEDPI